MTKKINDFFTSKHGMYRRYCDDIIMIIPMTKEELLSGTGEPIDEFIYSVGEQIPNLELNRDKTKQYFYSNGKVERVKADTDMINYLGFTFDGENVRIREKSLFKFYCRAYRKISRVKQARKLKDFVAGKKAIYQSYTHLGATVWHRRNKKTGKLQYGNFLTYAYKADEIFSKSEVLKSGIRNQVKRHWWKIDTKLKEDCRF